MEFATLTKEKAMKKVLLMLLVFATVAGADTSITPTLQIGTTFYGGFGYQEPGLSVGGGLEMSNPLLWASFSGSFSPTDKAPVYGNTYSYGGSFSMLGRLPKGVLFGGGVSYTNLRFVKLEVTKEAIRPSLTAGWENGRYRFLASRFFNGRDESNRSEGYNFEVSSYFIPEVRLDIGFTITSYDTISYRPELGRTTASGAWISFVYLPFQ